MSDETPDSLIPYDEIVQDALRAVVGRVLGEVEGPGGSPASIISTSPSRPARRAFRSPSILLERFPDEMTIVIQHRFWDLKVEDDGFSVGLSFGGVPATLAVPFAAVTEFHDPAVKFALTFQAEAEEAAATSMRQPRTIAPRSRRGAGRGRGPTSSAWTSRGRNERRRPSP